MTISGKGKRTSFFLPVIWSLALPLYDWCCTPCCKQSPLNSIEALQELTPTVYFSLCFSSLACCHHSKAISSAGKNWLSKFVSVRMYPVIKVLLWNVCQVVRCLRWLFRRHRSWIVSGRDVILPRLSAAHSSVSYHMGLSGFMFISGWTKLE